MLVALLSVVWKEVLYVEITLMILNPVIHSQFCWVLSRLVEVFWLNFIGLFNLLFGFLELGDLLERLGSLSIAVASDFLVPS